MKLIQLIALLVFVLFLTSCGEQVPEKAYNYKQGYTEVKLNLLENAPPEKIYPHSDFKIVVEVDNQCAYEINEGTVNILGLVDDYFVVYPVYQEVEGLLGRSLLSPSGDKQYLEFDGAAQGLFQNAEEYVANYFLKLNYQSKLEFSDSVCINPHLYAVYDAGCEVEEKKRFNGQGAPLAVTEMEEIISSGKGVEFRLTLENKGKGEVGTVNLGRAWLGGEGLDCTFQDAKEGRKIKFSQDKPEATLICRKSFSSRQNSYVTTLALDFTYDYELREEHKLKLVK